MWIIISIIAVSLIVLFLFTLVIANAYDKSRRKKFYKEYQEIVSNLNYLRQNKNESWFDKFSQNELEFWECEFMKLFN